MDTLERFASLSHAAWSGLSFEVAGAEGALSGLLDELPEGYARRRIAETIARLEAARRAAHNSFSEGVSA